MRAANRAVDERIKKDKDDKEPRRRAKQRARLNRGKRRQGSEEEEEEEEEGDGSGSPVQWDELGGGDGFGSPIQRDELSGRDKDLSLSQVGPFPWHAPGQEGEDTPPEPTESSRPTPSRPPVAPPKSV